MKNKTSLMEKDIEKHEHEVTIYDSYEIYAVCDKCGMHDWEEETIDDYKNKYPKHEVLDVLANLY